MYIALLHIPIFLRFLKLEMSTNKSVTLLNNLKPRLTKSRVQVKLIHSWKQTPPYANDQTLEMVFADETVSSTPYFKCCFIL